MFRVKSKTAIERKPAAHTERHNIEHFRQMTLHLACAIRHPSTNSRRGASPTRSKPRKPEQHSKRIRHERSAHDAAHASSQCKAHTRFAEALRRHLAPKPSERTASVEPARTGEHTASQHQTSTHPPRSTDHPHAIQNEPRKGPLIRRKRPRRHRRPQGPYRPSQSRTPCRLLIGAP